MHGDTVFTACIGRDGRARLDIADLARGEHRVRTLFDGLERDDHNNPSLVFFRGRLYAFSAPHSGYQFPSDRRSRVRYRVSTEPWGEGGSFGAARTIPLPEECGLGFTYPNPVPAGNRLYLFLRGPCWEPYVTWTDDGRTWAPPRTLVRAPDAATQDAGGTDWKTVRPYAKYAPGPGGSVLMAFSDGHPGSYPSSLYYLRLKGERLLRADGSLAGTLDDVPLGFDDLDRVQRHSPSAGRAWPMDIGWDRDRDAPVVVYSSLRKDADMFRYAAWDGERWRRHDIDAAGGGLFHYHNGGITLHHGNPSWVVLTRKIGDQHEIEARHTPDAGATWETHPLTRSSSRFNIRPVIPRGLRDSDELVVAWVAGRARSFRAYRTQVRVRAAALPPSDGGTAP
jgi:hypothetical protein